MDFLDDLFKKLFPKRNQNIPLVKESLERSEKDKLAFDTWTTSYDATRWYNEILLAYEQKKQGLTSTQIDVHLFRSAASNGIAISYTNAMSAIHFRFLFDRLKESVLSLPYPYKLYTSDRAHYERQNYVETIEKHYLKPVYGRMEQGKLLPQFYGNILIEYILIDNKPSFIRLLANVYSDRLFSPHQPFEELVYELFRRKD